MFTYPLPRHILVLAFCMTLACNKTPSTAATPAQTSTDKPATLAADLAAGKLAGLYHRQRNIPLFFNGRMTFNLVHEFYYFFPDGHIVFGVPTAGLLKAYPTAADLAAFKDLPPDQRGTYTVANNQITFKPEKGQASTEPFSIPTPNDDSTLQIGEKSIIASIKALPFKDKQTLSGEYVADGTTSFGITAPNAGTIFNVSTLKFSPDGALTSDHLAGVDTQGIQTTVGSSGITTGGTTTTTGTYTLNNYTLTTTIAGTTKTATVFHPSPEDKPDAPSLLYIDGKIYSLQEKK